MTVRPTLPFLTVAVLFVTGCQKVMTADLVSIPDYAVEASRARAAAGARAADADFESRYQAIKAAAGKGAGRAAPATDSGHVMSLLGTDVVQGVVDEVYSVRSNGTRSAAPPELGDGKIRAFRKALTMTRATLLDDVANGKAGGKKLDRILVAYFKAYAAGEFVDRNGTEIAKPSVNGGINNEAITGLTAVFWEALFDFWTDVPVFVEEQKQEKVKTTYRGPDEGEVTPVYTRSMVDVHVTDDNRVPTALALDVAHTERLVASGAAGIDSLKAKAIKAGSNYAGKKANALAGGIFGNIGFVLIPGFSVGDDKTLLEIVKTSAEVGTRRGTQAALYKVLKENVRSAQLDRVVSALDQKP
jgi:hypothetical protein